MVQLLAPKQLHNLQPADDKTVGPTQTPDLTSATKSGPPAQQSISKVNAFPAVHDCKYNIVLYGVHECPKGTNRSARTKQDLEKVTEIAT